MMQNVPGGFVMYEAVAQACKDIAAEGLVKWSSGNVSARIGDWIFIKASGVLCKYVTERSVIAVDLAGRYDPPPENEIAPRWKPSTDTAAHLYIYNHLRNIGAVVHTHSTYATIFAVMGKPIPCCMTSMADEFGGSIQISDYCEIGGEDIGKEVVRMYEVRPCHAFLIRQHGVFTVGESIEAAVKAAVMGEEAAKVAYHAILAGGSVKILSDEQIIRNHRRYMEDYGQ